MTTVCDVVMEVDDYDGNGKRKFQIKEFTYRPAIKTIFALYPDDDQIGCEEGFDDVLCVWLDTLTDFTDQDWDRYGDTVTEALTKYQEAL